MIKLYSNPACPDSHRTRIVLAEKDLPIDVVEIEDGNKPAELLEANPYGNLPTIVDRDTILFESSVINEYLDERYPHPPLKPGSPAERAQMRLSVLRLEHELYPLYTNLVRLSKKAEPRKKICEYFEIMDTYLARQTYLVSDVYTLADVSMAPILWRLSSHGVDTSNWLHLEAYMGRLFERPAFERSLSEHEQMLRD